MVVIMMMLGRRSVAIALSWRAVNMAFGGRVLSAVGMAILSMSVVMVLMLVLSALLLIFRLFERLLAVETGGRLVEEGVQQLVELPRLFALGVLDLLHCLVMSGPPSEDTNDPLSHC